jgi:transcriptional regulator with XRE-family HTH domain
MTSNIKNKELVKKIGQRIFTLRKMQGLSREELACRIGIGQQQILKYEIGYSRITADRIANIAKALNLELSLFFPREEFSSYKKNSTNLPEKIS